MQLHRPFRAAVTLTFLSAGLLTPLASSGQQVIIRARSANEEIGGAFGASVGGVSDMDADGRGDFVAGAPMETSDNLAQGGRVYAFSGRIGARLFTLVSPRNEESGHFGWSVAGVPDTNADGKGDIVVGAPRENPGPLPLDCGRAYLFSGDGTLRFIFGSQTLTENGLFGFSVSGVPDVNGDNKGEVIVGAPGETAAGSPAGAGRAHVYSANGGKLLTLKSPTEEAGQSLGFSVSGAPDFSGDNRGDVIVGAPMSSGSPPIAGSGRAYLFNGRTGALLGTLQSLNRESAGQFGWSVAGIRDMNGDLRGDVAVGAPAEDPGVTPNNCGRVYVFSGATGAIIRVHGSPQPVQNGLFGTSVAGTLDMNGDFRGELIVGAPGENASGVFRAGRVHVYSGWTGARLASPASFSPQYDGKFGVSVAGAPDANFNGKSDAVAGSPAENPEGSPVRAGRGYLLKF